RPALGAAAALAGVQALLVAAAPALPPLPGLAGLAELQGRPNLTCDWRVLGPSLPATGTPRLLLLGNTDGFNPVQVNHAAHRLGRRIRWEELRSVPDPAALRAALDRADLVLLLVAGQPEALPPGLYHPPSQPPVLALPADPAALSPGLQDAGEVAAPGAGGCRARVFSRIAAPGQAATDPAG
ncbi:hypothetical protein, partial [Paracraurococcus ruber]